MSPTVSVVVPAYGVATADLDELVAALLDQERPEGWDVELQVVASAEGAGALPVPSSRPGVHVEAVAERVPAAEARNRAAGRASGDVLAFIDADARPEPGWLVALLCALEAGATEVVGGAVVCAPTGSVGRADHLLSFLDVHPARPRGPTHQATTCNLAMTRAGWERWGPFREGLTGGEDSVLTWAAGREGALVFVPSARVVHRPRSTWPSLVAHQWCYGRFTRAIAVDAPPVVRLLTGSAVLAPVAAAARLVRLFLTLARWDRHHLRASLPALPALVAGLTAWAAGVVAGPPRPRRR